MKYTLTDHGRYEQGIFTQLNPGQSYTITAHFDGDSNQHLQPASATTTINVKGSTGNTPDNTNAGNTPESGNTYRIQCSVVSQRTQHFIFF